MVTKGELQKYAAKTSKFKYPDGGNGQTVIPNLLGEKPYCKATVKFPDDTITINKTKFMFWDNGLITVIDIENLLQWNVSLEMILSVKEV